MSESQRALRLLEFEQLLQLVAEHCALERGARRVLALVPQHEAREFDELWSWIEELLEALARGGDPPLGNMADLPRLFGDERAGSGSLNGEELAAVAGACVALGKLLDFVRRHEEQLPRTARLFATDDDPTPLGERLWAALETDGSLKDSASPTLGSLRRKLRSAERTLRSVAQESLAAAVKKGQTEAAELVLRGDRYCIPIAASKRRELSGIVHDRSNTGQTLFIEPAPVVEAANQLADLRLDIAEEEARIFASLNAALAERSEALLSLFEHAVQLDSHRARARWGRQQRGHAPQWSDDGALSIDSFRHPLLERTLKAQGAEGQLVPLDLQLSADASVLLLSGPNAGGKTVALKAMGLAILMGQTGIPLPAVREPTLPRVDHVLVDLGDEQSIADSLSSFSAHVTHLKGILDAATSRSFLLLDEVGGGTDPLEGVAIARALIEHLRARVGYLVCTTHYGQLKALAQELDGVRNASMEYDREKMLPRFRLVLDRPGSSHALEIAQRIGLPVEVVERARELVGDEHLSVEALLEELERERADARSARQEAEVERSAAAVAREAVEEAREELRSRRKELLDAAETEAEGIVRNARARLERLLEELRRSGAGEAATQLAAEAREEMNRKQENLIRAREKRQRPDGEVPDEVEVGQRLRHRALDAVGTVVELRGERITLDVAGRRVQTKVDQLEIVEGASQEARAPEGNVSAHLRDADVKQLLELDLRGHDVEDAWVELDRTLDRCQLEGLRRVTVIHGKGTGALRRGLNERLRRDPRVRRASIGGGGAHDEGVTVVELA